MGFFGKLFGKKKDEFDFSPGKDSEMGLGPDLGMDDSTAGLGGASDSGNYPDTRRQPLPTLEPVPEQTFQQARAFQQTQQWSQQPSFQSHDPTYIISKNLEVVSSKLDALQAALESINQRLINLENIARGEQQERSNKYRW